jgi:O-antigen ligase
LRSESCDQLILSITLFLILFAPLAFGAVENWALLVLRVSVLLMLGVWGAKLALQRRNVLVRPPCVRALLLFLLLVLVQLTPFPASWRGTTPRTPHSSIAGSSQTPGWTTLSFLPKATLEGLVDLLTYAAFGLVLINNLRNRRKLAPILNALIALGCFEAVYGMIEYWSGHEHIFWYPKTFYRQEATGTYINHNHFAGLLELILPLTVGAFFVRTEQQREPEARFPSSSSVGWLHSSRLKSIGLVAAIAAMAMALVLSKSRAGIVSSVISLIFLASFLRKKLFRLRVQVPLVTVLLVGIVTLKFNWDVIERFSWSPYEARIRMGVWRDGSRIVRDYPLLGSGLGTFQHVIPYYRSRVDFLKVPGGSQPAAWFHAHNDYLQLLIECGIVGLVLAGVWFAATARWFLTSFRRSQDSEDSILGYSLLSGMLALLVHSFIDFNFHIPANALLFCVLLSLSIVLARSQERLAVARLDEAGLSRSTVPATNGQLQTLARGQEQ